MQDMLSQLDTLQGLSGDVSPDQSACSLDTGDVLIRSTRVLLSDRGQGPEPSSVQITVQKLGEHPIQPHLAEQQSFRRDERHKLGRRPDRAATLRGGAQPQPGESSTGVMDHPGTELYGKQTLQKPGPTKEIREPRRKEPAVDSAPHRKHSVTQDVLTSRFDAGGRGAVLAALKQRSHSAPHRKEIKVQLLGPGSFQTNSQIAPRPRISSQDPPCPRTISQDALGVAGVPMETGLSSSYYPGDATVTAAAAAAAAAVSAAAPLIKAQSDLETRVCQLANGVEKLLQAERDGVDSGRSLSQQTLHHLEKLHGQQLQLQSQLESTLKMVVGHAPVTSDLTSRGQAACLQVKDLEPAEIVISSQQSSSATRAATAVETEAVAMTTSYCDQWTEHTRHNPPCTGEPSVSTTARPATKSHLQSTTSHSKAAAKRANEMLREMGRLRTEMKMLTQEDPLKTTRPRAHNHQTQQKQSQPNHIQSHSKPAHSQKDPYQSHQSCSQKSQSKLVHSQRDPNQPPQSSSQQNQSKPVHSHEDPDQPPQSSSQQNQSHSTTNPGTELKQNQSPAHITPSQSNSSISQQNQTHQTQFKQVHSQSLQPNSPLSHPLTQLSSSQQTEPQQSQFQSQQAHSQSCQSLYHQNQPYLPIPVQRRPVVPSTLEDAGRVLRQVRRQKKVLEDNLEALLRAKTGEVLHCQLEALASNRDWTEEVRIKKTVDAWISTLSKDIQAEMSSEEVAPCRVANTVSKHANSRAAAVTSQRAAGSSIHTSRGKPKSTVGGTGSKNATGKGSRGPVRGAEPVRASGRQTDRNQVEDGESYLTRLYGRAPYEGVRRTLKKSPYLRFSSPVSPLSRKPRPRLVESVRGVKVKSCKTQTSLAPPLILLPGQPQHHHITISSRMNSHDPADLTVTPADSCSAPVAILLSRPRMDSSSKCATGHQQEVTSQPTAPGVAALRSPELQSQEMEQQDTGETPPPSIAILERKSEEEGEQEEEENVFPGTDFLSVADVMQDEGSVRGEEEVELDGGPSPPPVLYQGPVFPPQALPAIPSQDQAPIQGLNLQRDPLENRLVEWVEQQLMSRMISEMYRPLPSDPVLNELSDQSEQEDRSVTSDIVEAAGGAGLQLFVDLGTSVDSDLIRQLVKEVLTEEINLMLGHRDTQGPETEPPGPGPEVHHEDKLVPLVPTPSPTPPPSPTMPSRETPLLTTPPPSEPTSLQKESPQPIEVPELVATPSPSPEPTHPPESPQVVHQATSPPSWGNTELPLNEERPEDTQPSLVSVAEEEPFIQPAPSPSLHLPPPPGPDPRPVSPSSSSDGSSTSNTSDTTSSAETAETEAALKHISEGELLISVNQLAAMTDVDAACSFSSSLQELQDMDIDPPSEEVRGHEILRTLLAKMEQYTQRGERPQPEGSWGREEEEEEVSVGEVRDDWTTKHCRTTNPQSLGMSSAAQQGHSSRQLNQSADVSEVSIKATDQGLVATGNQMVESVSTLTSDLHAGQSLSLAHLENTHDAEQVPPVMVTQLDRLSGEQQGGGARRMDANLLSLSCQGEEQLEEVMEECVSAGGDTDSSVSDAF
ncbi:protein TALPID3 isoform X2 [Halichoeres trimaculatus]|uniref:protein TALPID3 isoform X2 n=1 Tax=Halichoeres trimaculatus TaxID=147232 RepID=UPI003D9F7106